MSVLFHQNQEIKEIQKIVIVLRKALLSHRRPHGHIQTVFRNLPLPKLMAKQCKKGKHAKLRILLSSALTPHGIQLFGNFPGFLKLSSHDQTKAIVCQQYPMIVNIDYTVAVSDLILPDSLPVARKRLFVQTCPVIHIRLVADNQIVHMALPIFIRIVKRLFILLHCQKKTVLPMSDDTQQIIASGGLFFLGGSGHTANAFAQILQAFLLGALSQAVICHIKIAEPE